MRNGGSSVTTALSCPAAASRSPLITCAIPEPIRISDQTPYSHGSPDAQPASAVSAARSAPSASRSRSATDSAYSAWRGRGHDHVDSPESVVTPDAASRASRSAFCARPASPSRAEALASWLASSTRTAEYSGLHSNPRRARSADCKNCCVPARWPRRTPCHRALLACALNAKAGLESASSAHRNAAWPCALAVASR